jgi:hypothetical protein
VGNDIESVVLAISHLGRILPSTDRAWTRPSAIKVIDCLLSLRTRYDSFVVPRLDDFTAAHPSLVAVLELRALIDSYDTPTAFLEQELRFKYPTRANALSGVVDYLLIQVGRCSAREEADALQSWASASQMGDLKKVGVRGFGIAGFQYLRMLFGADTTKPDVHICRFVSDAVGRPLAADMALELLERAAPKAGVKVRDVDTTVWERFARN